MEFREIAQIAQNLPPELKPNCGTEPKFYGETRYGSLVMLGDRLLETLTIYQKLMVDDAFCAWLKAQTKKVRKKVRTMLTVTESL